jgi:hypothetical protein
VGPEFGCQVKARSNRTSPGQAMLMISGQGERVVMKVRVGGRFRMNRDESLIEGKHFGRRSAAKGAKAGARTAKVNQMYEGQSKPVMKVHRACCRDERHEC